MTKYPNCMTDCQTEDGITVGIIDSIITASHILSKRDLTSVDVFEAISDLKSQSFLVSLITQPQLEWRVVYREMRGKGLTGCCIYKSEDQAREVISGGYVNGISLSMTWVGVPKEVGLQCRDLTIPPSPWRIVNFEAPRHKDIKKADECSTLYLY
jgi:hypothetical protein